MEDGGTVSVDELNYMPIGTLRSMIRDALDLLDESKMAAPKMWEGSFLHELESILRKPMTTLVPHE